MELISVEIELGDLLVRDLDALGVGAGIQFGMDIESGRGAGGRDQAHNDLKTNQRLATPVLGNTRKEAVFDLVPFVGAGDHGPVDRIQSNLEVLWPFSLGFPAIEYAVVHNSELLCLSFLDGNDLQAAVQFLN